LNERSDDPYNKPELLELELLVGVGRAREELEGRKQSTGHKEQEGKRKEVQNRRALGSSPFD
jgi:hypothetical protein